MDPLIRVDGLTLDIGAARVLRGIDLAVAPRECWAVIGPNGAGKSSFLKCLARVFRNYGGTISLGEKNTAELSAKELARRMAYVPQSVAADLPFTVHDFVSLARYPWQSFVANPDKADLKIVEESLALVGVAGLAERSMNSLSGGERQKVLIASALAQRTDILLLDEPTTYLDYRHQVETLELVRAIALQDKTVIAVTHDVNFALRFAERIAALRDGSVAWTGTARELIAPGRLEAIYGTEFERFEGRGGYFVTPFEGGGALFTPFQKDGGDRR